MGCTANYKELSLLLPRDEVTETWGERSYQAANAEYEATFDATAPGASSQTYQGHDHTPQGGGGPINRGCLWSACTVSAALVEMGFSAKNQAVEMVASGAALDTLMLHASPGLRSTALLTGWICYYARNSDRFRVELDEFPTPYDFDLEVSAGEKINWARFVLPVVAPGKWKLRNLFVRCGSYDSASAPALSIYALQIDELPDVLNNRGRVHLQQPASTGKTIYVAFDSLEDDLVAVGEWLDSYSLKILYGFENGLYEGIEDRRAPGASSQTCRGHDHDSSNYGGRALARGGCYTATLQGTTQLYRLAYNGTSYSGYYAWDYDDGTTRRSNNNIGMALFWVSPDLTSSGNPPTGPPYLTAKLYVEWNADPATPTFNFRAKHLASGNYSAVTTKSSTASFSGWITIDMIPCAGDAINEIQFEVEMTGTGNTVNIDLYAFEIYEVPGVGGRTAPGSKIVLASGVD